MFSFQNWQDYEPALPGFQRAKLKKQKICGVVPHTLDGKFGRSTCSPPLPLPPDLNWELNPPRLYPALDCKSVQWDSRLWSVLLMPFLWRGAVARQATCFKTFAVERGRQRSRKLSHTLRMFPAPPRQGWEGL